mmetsp:Transcript_54865/g.146491  ORF Transcript_54865/g.146491 Transcript_54865/m.146491 type:complete len:82 (+) Transcript_54865:244-489(+)
MSAGALGCARAESTCVSVPKEAVNVLLCDFLQESPQELFKMEIVGLAADTASLVDRGAEKKTILRRMRTESLENYELDYRT